MSVHDNGWYLLNGYICKKEFLTLLNLFTFFPNIKWAVLTHNDSETWHGILQLKVTITEGILRRWNFHTKFSGLVEEISS